jgi:hypothetical protein
VQHEDRLFTLQVPSFTSSVYASQYWCMEATSYSCNCSSITLSLILESVVALCLFTHFFVRVRFFTSYGWSVLQSWIRHTSVIYYIASEDLWACGTFQPTVIAIVLLGRNAHFTLICGFICIEHIAEVHSSSNLEKLALHIRNHQIKTS